MIQVGFFQSVYTKQHSRALLQVLSSRSRPTSRGSEATAIISWRRAEWSKHKKRECTKSILKELGQDDKCKDEGADDLRRLKVEVIHLRAKLRGERGILNLLEAAAVDVPNAALPDVS